MYGIWDSIKELIEKIKNALGNLGGNISEIIQNLEEKIKEIIDGLNLQEVVEKIISKIKEIIGGVGGAVAACIEEQRPAVEQLAQESQAASMACVQEAQEKVIVIKAQVVALNEKAKALKDDVINRGLKCIKDNIMNPAAVIPCFKAQVEPITQEINQLKDQAVALVQLAKDLASQAATSLGACLSEVSEVTNAKQNEIITAIQTCISAH